MTALILGLLIFLGAHSVRIVAEDWRSARIASLGLNPWKGIYSLISLVGFVLIVWGYGGTRVDPIVIWNPPIWTRHLAALLTVPAIILVVAAYIPGNHIKAAIGHPMLLGVKIWALAHLISNGRLGDILLFGAFLVWAILDFRTSRRRDRATGVRYPAGTPARDAIAVMVGLLVWGLLAGFLHEWLIGVRPFG
ncbi:MAG TPA: NnrU family protein [Burkholderiales bacterium]|nr:NnrU family protein [Burkholderiales bacterium]